MIKSMTGFGRHKSQGDGWECMVEIKTVNHRYCDIYVKMPRTIGFLEDKVRELVGKSISRGKTDVYISFDDHGDDSKCVTIDEGLVKTYISAANMLRDKYQLKDDITVSLISKFPDILKVEKAEQDEEKVWRILKDTLVSALENLIAMRQVEGEGLKNSILEKVQYINELVDKISKRAPDVVKEYKVKLETRLKELLEQQVVDENRMAVEVAIFADRCSIDEELVRLKSHIAQLKETLLMTQPVGRKLDFLLQEMNREINTIGSKANDLHITRDVVDVKSELEKIREQIQNIE